MMRPVMSVGDVRAFEAMLAKQGIGEDELMRRAGEVVALQAALHVERGTVLVLCGMGNNGGDGWVAARLLAQAGFCVCVQALRAPADISVQPARDAAERAVAGAIECAPAGAGIAAGADGGVIPGVRAYRFQEADFGFEDCDCIVDCLLGIGFDGETVREPGRSLILQANAARAHRIACDVPSGMNADTGIAADVCFAADATVTMLAVKRGLIAHGSAGRVGDLFLAELNLPE